MLEPTYWLDALDRGPGFLQPAESVDFDVDARGEERQRRCPGAIEPCGGQEVLVQGKDLCRLDRVGRVVDLPLIKAVLKPGVEQIALGQEVFESSGYRRLNRPGHQPADQVRGWNGHGPAPDPGIENGRR